MHHFRPARLILLNSTLTRLCLLSELDVAASCIDKDAVVSARSYRPDFQKGCGAMAQHRCILLLVSKLLINLLSS